jgi:hypothetical protein
MNRPIREEQIVRRTPNSNYHIQIHCIECKEPQQIVLKGDEMYRLQTSDALMQNILPDQPAALREMFISGICPVCWSKIFKDQDDEE